MNGHYETKDDLQATIDNLREYIHELKGDKKELTERVEKLEETNQLYKKRYSKLCEESDTTALQNERYREALVKIVNFHYSREWYQLIARKAVEGDSQ